MNKWTKADDKPPKLNGTYLAAVSNTQVHILDFVNGRWYGHPYSSGSDINVTHWMDVPKTPQQKDWVYHV